MVVFDALKLDKSALGQSNRTCSSSCTQCQFKVSWLYPPIKGSLADCEPPERFEPRTHRLRGWTVGFPSQVPRRLLKCPELTVPVAFSADSKLMRKSVGLLPETLDIQVVTRESESVESA